MVGDDILEEEDEAAAVEDGQGHTGWRQGRGGRYRIVEGECPPPLCIVRGEECERPGVSPETAGVTSSEPELLAAVAEPSSRDLSQLASYLRPGVKLNCF